jgi:hypothetical protein
MKRIECCVLAVLCCDLGGMAWAAPPASGPPAALQGGVREGTGEAGQAAGAAARRRPCQHKDAPERILWPQGNWLLGTRPLVKDDETSSVLMSVDLSGVEQEGADGAKRAGRAKLEGGHLAMANGGAEHGVGAVLHGTASDGRAVDVAICSATPDPGDADMVWYRVEAWDEAKGEWANPCKATAQVEAPRALAVGGVWDPKGARGEGAGRFTLACENGAIAKCAMNGYKPWQTQGGQSLVEYHQACTRMARADYCGNGKSHTTMGTLVDVYDGALVQREVRKGRNWDPARGSFEAAWATDGAYCMARTRDGQALAVIKKECPERWVDGVEDLGEEDRCVVRRKAGSRAELRVRNRSYGPGAAVLGAAGR